MDERTLATVMLGALLVGSSVLRAERNASRAAETAFQIELGRFVRTWRSRVERAGAVGTGVVGIGVLLFAYRQSRSVDPPGEQGAVSPFVPPGGRSATTSM